MTPDQWAQLLTARIIPRAIAIDHYVREACRNIPIGAEINTQQLLERLYPAVTGEMDEIRGRQKLLGLLMRHDNGIPEIAPDCRHRGPPRMGHFRMIRPWIWHRSTRA
jgi:hypothetical protein